MIYLLTSIQLILYIGFIYLVSSKHDSKGLKMQDFAASFSKHFWGGMPPDPPSKFAPLCVAQR